MSDTTQQDIREVTTPVGFLSYPHLERPDDFGGKADTPKYRLNLVVVEDEDGMTARQQLAPVVAAMQQAAKDRFDSASLDGLKLGIEPVDEETGKTFGDPDGLIVRATAKAQPKLFSEYGDALDASDPTIFSERFYAGAVVRCRLWAFGWDTAGRGVSFVLQGVQYVDEGERLGKGATPVAFEPVRERPKQDAFSSPSDAPDPDDALPF